MSLGQELVAIALGYARARFAELRTAVLTDADTFAQALGPGATAAQVAAHLDLAKAEFDAAGTDLDARNLVGSATHFGAAIHALDLAAQAAGVPLKPLLDSAIGWSNADPQGLPAQLGLPAVPPTLQLVDGALSFTLSAPGRTILPAPLLKFRALVLIARLRVDPAAAMAPLSVNLTLDDAEIGVGGGPIGALLGGASGSAESTMIIGFDSSGALTLSGGVAAKVVLPARPSLGPIDIHELAVELPPGEAGAIDASARFSVDLGGVITATVEGAGVELRVGAGQAAAGQDPLAVGLKLPTGIGLSDRRRSGQRRWLPRRTAPAASAAPCSCGSDRSTSKRSGCSPSSPASRSSW